MYQEVEGEMRMLKGRQKDEYDNSCEDLEKVTRKSEVDSNYKLATRSIDQHVSVYFILSL